MKAHHANLYKQQKGKCAITSLNDASAWLGPNRSVQIVTYPLAMRRTSTHDPNLVHRVDLPLQTHY